MTRKAIEEAIPHRGPMLLVDEIVTIKKGRILCRKTFRDDEYFFQGHYPDHPLVPGVILCECAMQAGGILLSNEADGLEGVPVATRMNQVRFRRMVRPGETIDIEVRLRERLANAFFLDATVRCDGKAAVRFEFACTLAPVDSDLQP